jgi:hypothetical protein
MTSKAKWSDLSKRERLDLMCETVSPAVKARVEHFFRGRAMTDPQYVMNVVLREAWREQHGDTAEWDRNAAAGGVVIR